MESRFHTAFLGGIEMWELILFLFIVGILFGVAKLSQAGEALGKAIRRFRNAAEGKPDPTEKNS
jgi:TatA/E family protein of Tat protein translocase